MIKITDVAKKGFVGKIKFNCEGIEFGEIIVKKQLDIDISYYLFLFKIIKKSFKNEPELKIGKMIEIFEASYLINGKEKTEVEIEKVFGTQFSIEIDSV